MLSIERILKQERLVRAMTGLNLKAFKALESSFEAAYQQSLNKLEKERKRQQGGGRKATLRTTLDKMLYILDCLMLNATGLWNFYLETA